MRGDRNDGESQQGFAGERTAGACRGAFPGTQLEERGRSSQSSLCNIDMKTPAGGLLQRLTRCLEMQRHTQLTPDSLSPHFLFCFIFSTSALFLFDSCLAGSVPPVLRPGVRHVCIHPRF